MLIVSKFHDYYDSVLVWGVDKTVVYKRETKDIILKHKEHQFADQTTKNCARRGSTIMYTLSPFLVGFCGSLYAGIHIRIASKPRNEILICYDAASFWFFNEREKLFKEKDFLSRTYWRWRDQDLSHFPDAQAFFKPENHERWKSTFVQHKTPLFLVHYIKNDLTLTVNPDLEPVRFAAVKDPVTAFQAIYMYISGVLGTPANPTVDIDDKHKAKAHGHDGKYSFKKPPGGGQWR